MLTSSSSTSLIGSLPPRGAWIEIVIVLLPLASVVVAPPTGSVD